MLFRAKIKLVVTVLIAVPAVVFAQADKPNFPYRAFVIKDEASVYSGPGSVHYETERLKLDSTVEVYRHDPGGWCAIRPTPASFSLIPASAVQIVEDGVGSVVEDGIQVWVGTRLGAVENPLWQVKLKKDELLEILDEASWPNPEGHSTTWYQIAPPAGEYRWIRLSDLKPPKQSFKSLPDDDNQTTYAANPISSGEDIDGSFVSKASYQDAEPGFEDSLDPPSNRDSTVNRGWKKAKVPLRIADRRANSNPVEPFKIPAIESASKTEPLRTTDRTLPENAPERQPFSPTQTSQTANEYVQLDPIHGQVSRQMARLESALTKEMLNSPDQWILEPILKQATQLSTKSNDLIERQHAIRLIAKIRKCVAIQSNFESAYQPNGNTVESSLSGIVGTGVGGSSTTVDSLVQLGTTYDAHGWLNKLVRGKGSLDPTYVLENDKGEIIFHVAPAPGLNLNRYLKNKVGIIGRRGFHRSMNMNHVTADRVVVLDSIRR